MYANAYATWLSRLSTTSPGVASRLPKGWPERIPRVDLPGTVQTLRRSASLVNTSLLVIGWGDGSAVRMLIADPPSLRKLIHVVVMPEEVEAFAHALGLPEIEAVLNRPSISVHMPGTLDEALNTLRTAYSTHEQISRLTGTSVIADHPLLADAAATRAAWMPHLQKALAERLDCLGNDVYDTFLGAKHSLMHGRELVDRPLTSDLAGLYAGKKAICLASGPSARAQLDRVRELQHEHVVIVADSFLGAALAAGIEPHYVCMVERPDNMHKLIDGHAERTSAVMVALPFVHPTSVIPFGDRVAWWWGGDDLYPWLDPQEQVLFHGRSTGTMTLALAGHLGCAEAWLVGHDLAFKDGISHSSGTAPLAMETQAEDMKRMSRTNPNYYQCVFDVPRNGGGTIETLGIWNIFRTDIEQIVRIYEGRCQYINTNVDCGAVVAGSICGPLPEPGGERLERRVAARKRPADWSAYRERCLRLGQDFAAVIDGCARLQEELAAMRPLSHSAQEVERLALRMDISKMVDPRNRAWFTFVFRAALRNLMVKLYHNSFVRTTAERDWNQIQVMRLFTASMPGLLKRLQPELDQALEAFK